jgi:UDP-GlcNAc:undecaprenyl-phosphate GlcNAc-1-phosphate transferase
VDAVRVRRIVGVAGMVVREMEVDVSLALLLGFVVLLTLLGVYLAGVKVYEEEELAAAREKPLFAFLVDLSYKRRLFEVLLDVVLIILAYYSAYALLFGSWSRVRTGNSSCAPCRFWWSSKWRRFW